MTQSTLPNSDTPSVLPPNAPRLNRGGVRGVLTRAIGRSLLKIMGYRISGQFPNEKKLLIIAAPHTSNMDLILAFGTMMTLGVKINYVMKKEAFFFPFKSIFLSLGGLPVDRANPKKAVLTALKGFRDHDQFWLAVLPEGTRASTKKWKSGFSRIAYKSKVPIFMIGVDHPNKTLRLDKMFEAQKDAVAQAEELRLYAKKNFSGLNPENN